MPHRAAPRCACDKKKRLGHPESKAGCGPRTGTTPVDRRSSKHKPSSASCACARCALENDRYREMRYQLLMLITLLVGLAIWIFWGMLLPIRKLAQNMERTLGFTFDQ